MTKKSVISEAIESVVSHLKNHPLIVIDELMVNPPATEDELAAEPLVPTILQDFLRESNGLILSWHVKDKPIIRGGIVLPHIANIHDTRWSSFGVLDYTDDVHVAFQKVAGEDSRIMMESLEGDEDIEFTEMDDSLINIASYFAAFRKSFGFRFWQENYRRDHDYSIESIIENEGYLWGTGDSSEEVELHSAHRPN